MTEIDVRRYADAVVSRNKVIDSKELMQYLAIGNYPFVAIDTLSYEVHKYLDDRV